MDSKREAFEWVLRLPRAVGHTTAAAGVTEPGHHTVVVGPTQAEAKRVSGLYGVHAVPVNQGHHAFSGGFCSAVVFDVEAVKHVVLKLREAERRSELLVERLRKMYGDFYDGR